MTVLSTHRIDPGVFDAIGAGYGDAGAVETLVHGQLSRRKATVLAIADELAGRAGHAAERDRFVATCEALARVEAEAPAAVNGRDGVLRHPYLDVWGIHCLRELRRSRGGDVPDLAAKLSYLAAATGVAAARAGLDVELDVDVPPTGLPLPGLGHTVPTGQACRAVLRAEDGQVVVRPRDEDAAPLSRFVGRILAGGPQPVRLDDTDPFRNVFGSPVADRVDDATADAWAVTFHEAWGLIRDHHTAYLPGLGAGLTTVTPLVTPDTGSDASAAARRAFGAVGTVLPPTSARLALLLIHEFQHVKLGGLLDLVPLLDESDTSLYYAPWRPDPRPLPNLVQGTYAHLGVTDFWRIHRHHAGGEASAAAQQFARWRVMTAEAIDLLSASPALTDEGRRFADAMARTVKPWLDEPVAAADVRAAREASERHRAEWRAHRAETPGSS